ncbi:MAG: sulfatase-like hydrolase/transferase [Verrucomicrobiales bacterium]|nr:sulfatase-like hydrolase/transferase [Verrucomicrobiales bacterium]MCP5528592.1 sulfatase-like hydrolase/transferase [Verrucomicrobiales bacterium]
MNTRIPNPFPRSRPFSQLPALAVLLVLGWLVPGLLAAGQRPNIVFVFSDDHAVQAISAYGSQLNRTPNIDRLATEGALFVNSFCANSLCGPSRACILTGKHSHLNGFMRNGDRFDPGQTTFPKLLQKAGYQTAIIGKWHLASDPTGFNYWEVLPGQGSYYNPDFLQMDGSRKRYTGYCTDIITERSLEWLKHGRDQKQPFLLMCQHKAPHRNWSPAERHFDLFNDVTFPEPPTLRDDYAGRSRLLQENEMTIRQHMSWGADMKFQGPNLFPDYFTGSGGNGEYNRMTPGQKAAWDAWYQPRNRAFIEQMQAGALDAEGVFRWKYQRYLQDYLKCIQAVDDSVGRLLGWLDENGLADNTMVIYASDQGFYLGEHGWFDKRWMFEESLKMPFLIRWPGVIPAGVRSEALIQNIDYAPTFLDVAGVSVPSEIQGRSLVPVLKNAGRPTADWRDAIYYAYYENVAAHNVPMHDGVRSAHHKLMFFPRTREWQLFDLEKDPLELRSVHDDPAYAAVRRGLERRYRDLREFYDVNPAVIPAHRRGENWWRQREQDKNALAKEGNVELLFVGDSITQGWEGGGKEVWNEFYADRHALNLGFSGDRTEHVLWRLTRGNLANVKPKVAVVMIGTNNTGHLMQDPQEVAAGVRAILDVLARRMPETRIVLHGIFPRGASPWDEGRVNNTAINQIIRRFADGDHIRYLDLSDRFLAADSTLPKELMPDFLHPNAGGYRIWAEALEPTLQALGL